MLYILFTQFAQASAITADLAVLYAEAFLVKLDSENPGVRQTFAALRFNAGSASLRVSAEEQVADGENARSSNLTRRVNDMIEYLNSTAFDSGFSEAVGMLNAGCIDDHQLHSLSDNQADGFPRFAKAAIYTSMLANRSVDCSYNMSYVSTMLEAELMTLYAHVDRSSTDHKDCYLERLYKGLTLLRSNPYGDRPLSIDACLSLLVPAPGEMSNLAFHSKLVQNLGAKFTEITYPTRDMYRNFERQAVAQLSKPVPSVKQAQVWFNVLSDGDGLKGRVDLFGVTAGFTVSLEVEGHLSYLSISVGCLEESRVFSTLFDTRQGWRHVGVSFDGSLAILTLDELSWELELPVVSWDECSDAITYYQQARTGRLTLKRPVFLGPNVLLHVWDGKQVENVKVRFYDFKVSIRVNLSSSVYPERAHLIDLGDRKPIRCFTANGFESRVGFTGCRPNYGDFGDMLPSQQEPAALAQIVPSQDEVRVTDSNMTAYIGNVPDSNIEYWHFMYAGAGIGVLLAILGVSAVICAPWFYATARIDASVQASASEV